MEKPQVLKSRNAALDMPPEEYRRLGYQLVDRIADFLTSLPGRPVTPGETRQALPFATLSVGVKRRYEATPYNAQ
jgi:hypothetical protein